MMSGSGESKAKDMLKYSKLVEAGDDNLAKNCVTEAETQKFWEAGHKNGLQHRQMARYVVVVFRECEDTLHLVLVEAFGDVSEKANTVVARGSVMKNLQPQFNARDTSNLFDRPIGAAEPPLVCAVWSIKEQGASERKTARPM